jgi:hypothetical protein
VDRRAEPATTNLTFTYELVERNWAVATVGYGAHTVRLDVWHVTDALGVFLRSVVQLLEGYEFAWCVWEDEPGEHKWIFRQHGTAVDIRILRFPASFSGYGAPEEWATTIFEATCPLLKFATKVRNTVRRLASEVDADEYRLRWGHEFPQQSFDTLRRLICQCRAAAGMG